MGSAGQHHLMPSDTRTLFKTQTILSILLRKVGFMISLFIVNTKEISYKRTERNVLNSISLSLSRLYPWPPALPTKGRWTPQTMQSNVWAWGGVCICLPFLTDFGHMSVTWPQCSSNKVKSMTLFQWPFGWMLIISFAQISSCTEHVPYLTQSQSLLSLKVYFRSLGKRPQIRFCIGYVSCGMWK